MHNNRLASVGSSNSRGVAIRLDDQCHDYVVAHNAIAGPTEKVFALGDSNRGFLVDNIWDSPIARRSSDSATGSAEETQAGNLNPMGSRAPGVRRDKSKRRSVPSTCGVTGIEAL